MDADAADLMAQLCTRVGMIMEDASTSALTLQAADAAFIDRLDGLARAVDAAGILLRAAAVVYAQALNPWT